MYKIEGQGDWKHTNIWRNGLIVDYSECEITVTKDSCFAVVDGVKDDVDRVILNGIYTFLSFGGFATSKLFTNTTELRGIQGVNITINRDKSSLLKFDSILLPNLVEYVPRFSLEDCIYYAGLLDGEGSIGICSAGSSNYQNWCPVITLSNNDKGVLDYFSQFFNDGDVTPRKDNPRAWQVIIRSYGGCQQVLEALLPYLRIKRYLASRLLEFVKNRKLHTSFTQEELNLIEEIREWNSKRGILEAPAPRVDPRLVTFAEETRKK